MKCRDMLMRLSEYLDRELDPALCRGIDSHMAGCKPCLAFIRTLRKTVGMLKNQPRAVPSPQLRAELRHQLGNI